jgi:hypothetical protein
MGFATSMLIRHHSVKASSGKLPRAERTRWPKFLLRRDADERDPGDGRSTTYRRADEHRQATGEHRRQQLR